MIVMYPETKAMEDMDSYTVGWPSGVYTYSWGQMTLCTAAVLADLSLPEVLEPPLGAMILPSYSPSVSSSVMVMAGVCEVLTWCSTMFRTCCSMSRLMEALEVAGGLPTALVPGWADMGATCGALPWERCSTWVVIIARAVVKVPSICFTSIRVALSSGVVSS